MTLIAQLVVAVHGFAANTLLQALPGVLATAASAPRRWAIIFARLDPQQFLEPIEMGITHRRGGCGRPATRRR